MFCLYINLNIIVILTITLDIREQVFITVKSTILVFKVLLQVSWKFNFSIETVSNTLEPNYRVALMELEHSMQSHMSCIFVYIL